MVMMHNIEWLVAPSLWAEWVNTRSNVNTAPVLEANLSTGLTSEQRA